MLHVGDFVEINDHEEEYTGVRAEITRINEHNSDGDFYGIELHRVDGPPHTVYFWAEELTLVTARGKK